MKCLVAGYRQIENKTESDFLPILVEYQDKDYLDANIYRVAEKAEALGITDGVIFTQDDKASIILMGHFNWETAHKLKLVKKTPTDYNIVFNQIQPIVESVDIIWDSVNQGEDPF